MYTYSVSGYDVNNKKFSPCSLRFIRKVFNLSFQYDHWHIISIISSNKMVVHQNLIICYFSIIMNDLSPPQKLTVNRIFQSLISSSKIHQPLDGRRFHLSFTIFRSCWPNLLGVSPNPRKASAATFESKVTRSATPDCSGPKTLTHAATKTASWEQTRNARTKTLLAVSVIQWS